MTLSLDMKRIREKFGEKAEKVARGTFLSLAGRIVKSTPVGNPLLWAGKPPAGYIGGALRGGWNISANTPDETISNRIDKTGDATFSRLASDVEKLQVGDDWWMTNPLPYAARIEYEGWSSQAPEGMVRINVMQTQQVVNEQLKK